MSPDKLINKPNKNKLNIIYTYKHLIIIILIKLPDSTDPSDPSLLCYIPVHGMGGIHPNRQLGRIFALWLDGGIVAFLPSAPDPL